MTGNERLPRTAGTRDVRQQILSTHRLFVKKGGRTRPGEESLPTKMRSVRAQQGAYRRDSRIRSI